MKTIEQSSAYGAHWGLTDLYDEEAKNLRVAVESGEDFEFDYGCKKEIRYANITREGGDLTVTCRAYIDELPELTDTVIWRAFGGNDYADSGYHAIAKYHDLDLTKDETKIMEIMEECEGWLDDIYQECHESMVNLGDCRNYDEVITTIDGLEEEVENAAQQNYWDMIECAKESISAIAERDNMHRYV